MQFAEALRPWLEVRELFRVARGDEDVELQGDTPFVEHKQEKQRIQFQVRALSFEQEGDRTSEAVKESALNTFSEMNSISPLPTVEQVRFDSVFIKPYELSFHELRSLIGRTYFQPTILTEQATDIGVTLEQDEGHVLKHVRLGPMGSRQLQESYLHWPDESIPEQFIFIGLSFQWNVEMEFSTEELSNVLNQGQAWQESAVELVLADVSKVEGE